jgi:ubiquitin-like-conjugating enzyme ATG3
MLPNQLRSIVNTLRDAYYPANHSTNFREDGKITPEEFVTAGDYLVYKFPSWSWSSAASPSKRESNLPENKQFLVTRGVPCRRRLGGQGVGGAAELNEVLVRIGGDEGEDEEWLSAGGELKQSVDLESRAREVKSVDDSGGLTDAVGEEEEIPDMEDEEDDEEAIIRDTKTGSGGDVE